MTIFTEIVWNLPLKLSWFHRFLTTVSHIIHNFNLNAICLPLLPRHAYGRGIVCCLYDAVMNLFWKTYSRVAMILFECFSFPDILTQVHILLLVTQLGNVQTLSVCQPFLFIKVSKWTLMCLQQTFFEVGYKGWPFQKLFQSMMMKSQISLLWHSIFYWTGLLVKPGVMSWIQGFSRPLYGTSRELDILNRFFTTFS